MPTYTFAKRCIQAIRQVSRVNEMRLNVKRHSLQQSFETSCWSRSRRCTNCATDDCQQRADAACSDSISSKNRAKTTRRLSDVTGRSWTPTTARPQHAEVIDSVLPLIVVLCHRASTGPWPWLPAAAAAAAAAAASSRRLQYHIHPTHRLLIADKRILISPSWN